MRQLGQSKGIISQSASLQLLQQDLLNTHIAKPEMLCPLPHSLNPSFSTLHMKSTVILLSCLYFVVKPSWSSHDFPTHNIE